MFSNEKVEPAFIRDKYGFTEQLISYLNGVERTLPDSEML